MGMQRLGVQEGQRDSFEEQACKELLRQYCQQVLKNAIYFIDIIQATKCIKIYQQTLIMSYESPRFKLREDSDRTPGTPLPLRSPSPDFMSRSAILSTHIPNISMQHKNSLQIPIVEELQLLREENARLTHISNTKGQKGELALIDQLKQKDRLINSLRSQLKNTDIRSSRGLSLIGNSGHHSPIADISSDKRPNEELMGQIRRLELENEELRKRKVASGPETPTRPKPIQMDEPLAFVPLNQEGKLSRSSIDRIKEQLSHEVTQTFNKFYYRISERLQEIESRVSSIEQRVRRVPESGHKAGNSTIGSFPYDGSPGVISSFGNTTNRNNTFNTPDDKKLNGLNVKINELEGEVLSSRKSEQSLQYRLGEVEYELKRLKQNNTLLQKELDRMRMTPSPATHDIKDTDHQNMRLKQETTETNSIINSLKKENATNDLEIRRLRQELEAERRVKVPSFGPPQPSVDPLSQQWLQQQNFESEKRTLINQVSSLKDTLDELRRTNNTTLMELDEAKRNIESLRNNLDSSRKDNIELSAKLKHSGDSSQVLAQTEIMKLTLKINEMERSQQESEFAMKKSDSLNMRLNSVEAENRDLKNRMFDLETENSSLRKEAERAYSLAQENEMLKRTILSHERSQEELLKGSDHTKNQLMRVTRELRNLESQTIQAKSSLKMSEESLARAQTRIGNLQRDNTQLRQTNAQLPILERDNSQLKQEILRHKEEINRLVSNVKSFQNENQRLISENRLVLEENKQFDAELQRFRNDNEKEQLIHQINILNERMRNSENARQELSHQLNVLNDRLRNSENENNNLKSLEQNRNNELQSALLQLGEVKRLLTDMNFESVEAVIKELQHKEKIHLQEKQEQGRVAQQSLQQVTRLAVENDRLKKEVLECSKKYIEQKEEVDRMVAFVNHLEADKKGLEDKIQRLDSIIKQYINQDNISMILGQSEIKDTENSYIDNRETHKQLMELEHLKEPVYEAVAKLDRIAEKIAAKIGDNKLRRSGHGIIPTQSYFLDNSQSNIGNSGRSQS